MTDSEKGTAHSTVLFFSNDEANTPWPAKWGRSEVSAKKRAESSLRPQLAAFVNHTEKPDKGIGLYMARGQFRVAIQAVRPRSRPVAVIEDCAIHG